MRNATVIRTRLPAMRGLLFQAGRTMIHAWPHRIRVLEWKKKSNVEAVFSAHRSLLLPFVARSRVERAPGHPPSGTAVTMSIRSLVSTATARHPCTRLASARRHLAEPVRRGLSTSKPPSAVKSAVTVSSHRVTDLSSRSHPLTHLSLLFLGTCPRFSRQALLHGSAEAKEQEDEAMQQHSKLVGRHVRISLSGSRRHERGPEGAK